MTFTIKRWKKIHKRETPLSLTGPSFFQFALKKILNFVHFLLLLIQEVQNDAHGGLLQPNALDLVLQSVFHVAKSQGGVNQNYCTEKKRRINTQIVESDGKKCLSFKTFCRISLNKRRKYS